MVPIPTVNIDSSFWWGARTKIQKSLTTSHDVLKGACVDMGT
ncbi:MAG TPA: hypothetical protein VKA95_08640 [Nitrososphaeraceae archaeon]|nr:hypothetical protein [Nitrososphaeraceae archaeon]